MADVEITLYDPIVPSGYVIMDWVRTSQNP